MDPSARIDLHHTPKMIRDAAVYLSSFAPVDKFLALGECALVFELRCRSITKSKVDMYAGQEWSVKDLVGKRVRCIATSRIYQVIGQAGGDVIGRDEETGERVVLPARKFIQHSPFLICVGAVIQTVILADYAPLGDSAHLIRGSFFGSSTLALFAWLSGMSALGVFSAYLAGGLAGLAMSAAWRYRLRVRRRKAGFHTASKSR